MIIIITITTPKSFRGSVQAKAPLNMESHGTNVYLNPKTLLGNWVENSYQLEMEKNETGEDVDHVSCFTDNGDYPIGFLGLK